MEALERIARFALQALQDAGADMAWVEATRQETREFSVESGDFSLFRSLFDNSLSLTAFQGGRKGSLRLTGKLGDVMKESAEAAFTWVRAHSNELGLADDFYRDRDVHIHVPEGAVPKDGPSAGVTMTTALVSVFTGIPVRQDVAMTGEITLRGRVLPIGGLKEKTLAAYRAGITTLLIPKENEKDLEEVPDYVLSQFRIVSAENIDTVLRTALVRSPFIDR